MWAAILVALTIAGTGGSLRRNRRSARHRQAAETVAAIQIQGNTATPDEDVRRLADVRVGMPFDAATVDAVAARLRAAKRFERVDVRKRFASIADPSQIMLVIIVDEGPVKIVMTGDPDSPTRVDRKTMPIVLVLPILRYEDGYGFTYGARFTCRIRSGWASTAASRFR